MKMTSSRNVSTLGKTFADVQTITVDSVVVTEKTVPVAIAAQLTTRTGNADGVITLPAGHGITTGQKVDIYWGDTSIHTQASATISTNAMTIASGTGDNLPSNLTSVIVCVVREEPCTFASEDLQAIVAGGSTARSTVRFHSSADDSLALAQKIPADRSFFWDTELEANGYTNPFADEPIGFVRFSHANTANSEVMKVAAGVSN